MLTALKHDNKLTILHIEPQPDKRIIVVNGQNVNSASVIHQWRWKIMDQTRVQTFKNTSKKGPY